MRFVKLIAFLGLLLSVGTVQAKIFDAQSFTLENGLKVIVIPNHRAPVVSHMIWYQFGRADEKPGESGVAHFLEHLMFKGTPKVPDGEFSRTVRKLGGRDNAFTTRDYTAYYQNVPKAHLAKMMEMEADRMKNLTLKEDEVASERQVVIEERNQRVDNQPQSLFQEQMQATLYINHPYAIPVIGWKHEISALTQEQALAYYRQWYAPNNAIVILSGDVTAAEVKPLAQKYYGALKPSPVPKRIRPRPAPLNAKHTLQMSDPRIGIPMIIRQWRAPRGHDALDIFAEIAGGTTTARLYKSLVVEQKLAVSAGVDYDPISLNDTGLTLYASPAPGVNLEKLGEALDTELAQLLDKGVTVEELQSAKKRKKASFTWYLDSLQGPAMLFGRAISSGFDVDYVENWTDRIDALTVEDINTAAAEVFTDANGPITGLLLPAPKGGKQ
ncbi:MAG: pitrilysin family protein [Alphaproteobacteria bacterium]|nr:pitrilysin family protein [Alphaproteobacteria bacterium]